MSDLADELAKYSTGGNSPAAPGLADELAHYAGGGDAVQANGAAVPAPSNQALNFGQALWHRLGDLPIGAAQTVFNSVTKPSLATAMVNPTSYIADLTNQAIQKYGPKTMAKNAGDQRQVGADMADAVNTTIANRESDYQRDVPDNFGSVAGGIIGRIAPFLFGGPAKVIQGAGDAAASIIPKATGGLGGLLSTTGQRAASGVTQGLLAAYVDPATDPNQDFGTEKGKQLAAGAITGGVMNGAVLPTGSALLKAGKSALQPIIDPAGAAANFILDKLNAGGRDVNGIASKLLGNNTILSGSTPTTAQVAGTPEMVQIEKALGNTPNGKAALMDIANNNNLARWNALQGAAGTDADMLAAKAARSAATTPMRQAVIDNGKPVEVTPLMQQIHDLLQTGLGTDPQVRSGMNNLLGTINQLGAKGPVVGPNGPIVPTTTLTADVLDGIRQNANDYLRTVDSGGIVRSKQTAAMAPIRQTIGDLLEQTNPGTQSYLQKFAQMSQPLNDMKAAQNIASNFTGKALDSNSVPMLENAGFSSALKREIGNSDYPLSPKQTTLLDAIRQDLQRATVSNAVRQPGSDTAYNIAAQQGAGPMVRNLVGGGLGALFGGPSTAAAGYLAMDKIGNMLGGRTQNALVNLMTNPQAAGAALQRVQQPSAVGQFLSRLPLTQNPQLAAYLAAQQVH